MSDTFGAKQIATRIGTDPKTFRKFLRSTASPYEAVGQGGRYEFPCDELEKIKKVFTAWQKGKRVREVVSKPPTIKIYLEEDELAEAIMDFPDNDPTDADLDAIEEED